MALLFFVFGLCVGSFLNCVIYRLETDQSFLKGRSFCPQCRHGLGVLDLVPLMSFIFLKGRCRYCQKQISAQYPLVELATGILFVSTFLFYGPRSGLGVFYNLAIVSFLIVVFVFDLRHYLIPDEIIYPAILTVLLYRFFEIGELNHWKLIENWSLKIGNFEPLFYSLAVAFFAALFFWLIHYFSRGKAMGFGDVKLAFLMGLFLGFPEVLVALFFAFLSGAVAGIILMIFKKKTLKSELPFGPFLASGTLFALFWGGEILNLYINFLAL